jgi:invasion protein IalB
MFSISVYQIDSQELAGQLQFHCGMEQDGSVEIDWNQAQLSSMKVGMKLNDLDEVPMR